MGIRGTIGSIVTMSTLVALCGAVSVADAAAKGAGPISCKLAPPGVRCVPAACPVPSNGRPCRDPFAVCKRKGSSKRRCWAVKPPVTCGFLDSAPLINERSVEYSYIWSFPSRKEIVKTAAWDETTVNPDEAIPLIARLAAQGWDQERDVIDPIQRRLCAVDDPRLHELGTEIPASIPKWVFILNWHQRPTKFAGVERYGPDDHQRSLDAVNLHADRLGVGVEPPATEPYDDGQDDRNDAACPPGTLIGGVPC